MKSNPAHLMQKSQRRRQSNLGLTLIELMVSMTIGLILMVAVIGAYIGASGAGRTAEAIGRMNEDGQQALLILSQQLRMAGTNPSQPDRSTATVGITARGNSMPLHNSVSNAFAVRGCDLAFSDIATAASTSALTCAHAAASAGPDSISIAYEADRFNTIATNAGVPTDCIGNGITASTFNFTRSDETTAASVSVYEAENRFYIGSSAVITSPSLYCKGNGNANGQPLVENVENMQIRYGVVNPANASVTYVSVTPTFTTTLVLGYLTAHGVDNDGTLTGAAGSAARWNAVKTVRICVVVRSENEVLDSLASARYLDCNDTLVTTPSDRRLRRAFSTTVVLRNQ
ncbi:MAG: PilW family protein [Polaromonas sp.]